MNYYLSKLANVIYTDINLYDLNGNLIASSRPKVFEQGLLSEQMNTEAFVNLSIKEKTEFIHNENVGTLNYLSAYIPFENNDNKLLCYINLPYFAKQNDLEKEIFIRNMGQTVLEAINRQLAHYPYHVGQIVFIGKMLLNQNWKSLSIPKGNSEKYNENKFSESKQTKHFTDEYLNQPKK